MTLTDEARAVLAEIEAMSRENASEQDESSAVWPVWRLALHALAHTPIAFAEDTLSVETAKAIDWVQDDLAAFRTHTPWHVLPVYDGDRPEDLTDDEIRKAALLESEYRVRYQYTDSYPFSRREQILDRGRGDGYAAGVYETHRLIHEALAGEPTSRCKWCQRSVG